MTCDTKSGPLQDAVNLTPFDLYCAGIIIEEPTPNYFRYRLCGRARHRLCGRARHRLCGRARHLCIDDGKVGALHDTPEQAICHARKNFGVWEDDA